MRRYLKKAKKLIKFIREFLRGIAKSGRPGMQIPKLPQDAPADFVRQMSVAPTKNTHPDVFNFTSDILIGSQKVETYSRDVPICFGPGSEYAKVQGIVTFRGNNYRDTASFGTVNIKSAKLSKVWSIKTGRVARSSTTKRKGRSFWTGSGWTGQPLMICWPDDIRSAMNIFPEKKADANLVEVIYACMDGIIYFMDLKDGRPTRPAIHTGGGPIKGTASLYPDGTPMLFVGPADDPPGMETVRARVYSLIDQKLIYTFGQKDPDSLRVYQSYDSSPLFDIATDTIIEPGENGLLYTIKLNTKFDRQAGTLSVHPDKPVKLRYTTPEYKDAPKNTPTTRWLGMEDSACIWRNFLYIADNGGKLMCVDLNTMQMVWAQNVLDDTNTSPVFEECPEEGVCYIYISTSLHITATGRSEPTSGGVPIWKINAATGEIVWQTPMYPCQRVTGVSGGVQATPVLGKNDIADIVIYPVAHTPLLGTGVLVALDKKTGREVWKTQFANYCWSSPVAVYTPEGKSYIIQCDSDGNMFLLEGTTGRILDYVYLWSNIEASPAVFGNTVVVGTRKRRIYAVRIT
jgi:outer membrane protein assembly factor BamB